MSEISSSSDSGSHGAPSPDSSNPAHLKFSIYNILRPNGFGLKPSSSSPSTTSSSSSLQFNSLNPTTTPLDHQNTSPLSLLSAANFDDINDAVADMDQQQLPAWIYCTRYSDRPSAGPRHRKTPKRREPLPEDEKRPRTAFTADQLERLKQQFHNNKYLTEKRRQELAHELGLNESQIKIWFQNKRAKLKKANLQRSSSTQSQSNPTPNPYQLMAQNLYNRLGLALKQQ